MKKLWMALLGILVIAAEARGQGVVCSFGLATPNYNPGVDQVAAPAMTKSLKKIMNLLCPKGCGRVSLVKNASASSMLAMNVGNGSTKIAYSAAFIDRLQGVHGVEAAFGVLAHAAGHHVDGSGDPAAWMDPSWNGEVRAEAWAGCALAKAGMKVDGLKAAIRAVAANPSGADLGVESRFVALQRGYGSCGGGLMMASSDMQPVSATRGGCSSNGECRGGRVCAKGRCQDRPSQGVCLKDIDCPESQICGAVGRCEQTFGSLRESDEPAFRTAAETKFGGVDCHKQCEGDRRRCRVAAVKSLNDCLARVRSDPEYVACACPTWPVNKPECRQTCETSFDRGESCESDYVPTREACISAAACAGCDSTPAPLRAWERQSALK